MPWKESSSSRVPEGRYRLYGWIWRQLPGSVAVRAFEALLLLSAVVALLLFVVFSWLSPQLPINEVVVQ